MNMASIPITPIFPRRQFQLATELERTRSRSVGRAAVDHDCTSRDPCSADPLGNTGQTPGLANFLMRSGQRLLTRANADSIMFSSTECLDSPMGSPSSKCMPSLLMRSTSTVEGPKLIEPALNRAPAFIPTILSQAELKPVPSQPAQGVGPRKG